MARIRTIKPEFWKHEGLCELPEATHMFAAALLNYADDYGYFNANPKLIESELYPLRKPSVKIPEMLRSLATMGYIALGDGADGRRYGRVVNFSSHQRISHPAKEKLSQISITWDNSGNPPEPLRKITETLRPEQGTGKGTGNREEVSASRFQDFWLACPKKVGKGKAETLFKAACSKTSPDLLIEAMRRYAKTQVGLDPTYTAHPATWLSQRRWEDEAPGATVIRPSAFNSPEEQENQRKLLEKLNGRQAQN